MVIDYVDMAIENRAGRDILSGETVTLEDRTLGHETLLLSTAQYRYLLAAFDHHLLVDTGVSSRDEESRNPHQTTSAARS